jgi:glycosyltransferase involved in cell wall biosynthesis
VLSSQDPPAVMRCHVEWLAHESPAALVLKGRTLAGGLLPGAELVLSDRAGVHRPQAVMVRPAEDSATFQVDLDLAPGGQPLLALGTWDLWVRSGETQCRLGSPPHGAPDARPIIVPTVAAVSQVAPVDTDGHLSFSVERMLPYAEIEELEVEAGRLTASGTLVGVRGSAEATGNGELLVRQREDHGNVVTAPVALNAERFRLSFEFAQLPLVEETAGVFDLLLRIPGYKRELRLGAHFDDVGNKKQAIAFPRHRIDGEHSTRTIEPFYTIRNNLSLRSSAGKMPSPVRGDAAATSSQASRPTRRTPLRIRAKAITELPLALLEAVGRRRRVPRDVPAGRPKVYFVITHAFGMGGTIRTVLNVASDLARDHDVEIVSVVRTRMNPFFPIDARVKVSTLLDETRPDVRDPRTPLARLRAWLNKQPSWMVHPDDAAFGRYSLWLDIQLYRKLHSMSSGTVITTRPCLNIIAARFAHPGIVTIGQEHMNAPSHKPGLRRQIETTYGKLDALAVLTVGDEQDYAQMLRGQRTKVARIGNALPESPSGRADPESKRVIAAGRYTRQKGFDLLIRAFEQVARMHPDWQLRIFGSGPELPQMRRLVADRGLYNHVLLMGRTDRLGREMTRSSIYVLSSRFEGFGMVIIEAMSHGMAVVSFDCPRGPSDIIADGVDGTLVPAGDVDRLAAEVIALIEDEEKRRSYGEAALRKSQAYSIELIGHQWRQLLSELATQRR